MEKLGEPLCKALGQISRHYLNQILEQFFQEQVFQNVNMVFYASFLDCILIKKFHGNRQTFARITNEKRQEEVYKKNIHFWQIGKK